MFWCLVPAHEVWGADCNSIPVLLLGKYSSLDCLSFIIIFFFTADIIKYYKFSNIKQHKCVILYFCRLEVQHSAHRAKTKVLAGLGSLLEGQKENFFSWHFQLIDASRTPWLLAFGPLSPPTKVQFFSHHVNGIPSVLTSLPLILCYLFWAVLSTLVITFCPPK